MAVSTRTKKDGVKSYRAEWRNPVTGKVEKGPWTDDEIDARQLDNDKKRQIRDAPESFMKEPQAQVLNLTFRQLANKYLAEKIRLKEISPSTLRSDVPSLRRFIYPIIGDKPAAGICKADMQALVNLCKENGHKANTVNRKVSIVKSILSWAEENGHIETHPVATFKAKRGKDAKNRPPDPDELAKILAVAPPHIARVAILGYCLGVRVGPSELLKIEWSHYRKGERKITVLTAKKKQEGEWRDLDVSDDLAAHLETWARDDEKTQAALAMKKIDREVRWLIHRNLRPVTNNFRKAWAKTLEDAKITRRIRPYDLRHAHATTALDKGADAKSVATNMGHSDTTMIYRHYQHVLDRQRKEAMTAVDLGSVTDMVDEKAQELRDGRDDQ